MTEDSPVTTGVIGTGNMGYHHARVYAQNQDSRLVGVADADEDAARSAAERYGTEVLSVDELLSVAEAVSVAVPTRHHYDLARRALEAEVDVLVEKPLVKDPTDGATLVGLADENGCVLQVGHIERFNPAVRTLYEVVADLDIIGLEAQRLGPPVDRDSTDGVVRDLMVHDLDVALSLVDREIESVAATGTRSGRHVAAHLRFEDGVVGQFTASRVTQQKVRRLSVTTDDCRINVDYKDQDVRIHRRSVPAYVPNDGEVRYRQESIIERPTVENGEPLAVQLDAFLEAVRTGSDPPVTGDDGLRALELAAEVDRQSNPSERRSNVTAD